MEKIIFCVCFLLMAQTFINNQVFADEIIDSKGTVIPCKIETVEEGFVEYHKEGNLYKFAREENSPIYNDYVDVKVDLFKKDSITRYTGKIIVKDMWGTRLRNENGDIEIPFYKIKFVGVYKP